MQLAALVLHLLSPRGKVQRVHDLMPALDASGHSDRHSCILFGHVVAAGTRSAFIFISQQQQQPHEPYGQQRIIPAPQTTLAAGAVHRHHRVSSGFGKWIRRSQKMKNCFQWAIQKFKWEIDIFGLKNSGIRNFTPPSPGVKFG
eukprot:scaffold107013_cov20-Tisochrysis_lutea.AAC.3